jgi:hypothetical protein
MTGRKTTIALFLFLLFGAYAQSSSAAIKIYDLKVSGCWG